MMDLTQTGRYARIGRTQMEPKRQPKTEERIDVIVRDEDKGSYSTFDIPKNADVVFDLGEDKHLRPHKIHVRINAGPDGTLGVSIRSTMGGLTIHPETGNAAYVTTLRADLMPPKPEPVEEDGGDYDPNQD